MKRSIWKWGCIALLTFSSLIVMNAVRLNPMTLNLTVLSDNPIETASTTATSPQIASSQTNFDHALSERAVSEPSNVSEADHDSTPLYVPGEFVQLLPESPATVAIPGVIKGTIRLSNPHSYFWQVTIEGTVVLANGTTQKVLNPRTLWMTPKQTLQRPVQLQIDSRHFMPGLTQFKAILKDDQGRIIDQASISFTLTVDFP